ncbi:MAG: hypothetical protein KDA92_08150 [Planctomycetales bacterium]|nr:hypothetical protein [Planctomycetales bacterium]
MNRAVQIFREQSGNWGGCDWTTQFGAMCLNLKGLTARQAKMMANATTGSESTGWQEAADWLQRVEVDAQSAELAAKRAIELLPHDTSAALTQIRKACELERRYRDPRVWLALLEGIQDVCKLA